MFVSQFATGRLLATATREVDRAATAQADRDAFRRTVTAQLTEAARRQYFETRTAR